MNYSNYSMFFYMIMKRRVAFANEAHGAWVHTATVRCSSVLDINLCIVLGSNTLILYDDDSGMCAGASLCELYLLHVCSIRQDTHGLKSLLF